MPDTIQNERVRVQLAENELNYDSIKAAIYAQAKYLAEHNKPVRSLLLSRDIYEILNRRVVFRPPAQMTEDRAPAKDLPHFITPYGNLRVSEMTAILDEPQSFIVE